MSDVSNAVVAKGGYSIKQFCVRWDICPATYYNMKKAGKGPREMEVLGRKIISVEADAAWSREREAEAAAKGAAA